MIKLEMDQQQVNKVMAIYGKRCYTYKGKADKSLFVALQEKMKEVLAAGNEDSDKIVHKFLEKNFGDGQGGISDRSIYNYLSRKDITAAIVDFWSCVAEVWIDKLKNDNIRADFKDCLNGVTAAEIAEQLSKWDGVREYVIKWKKNEKENKVSKDECLDYVRGIITTKTFPLFHIPNEKRFKFDADHLEDRLNDEFDKQMENQKPFEIMIFRYHIDVFGKSAGKNSPAIKGALEKIGEIFDYDLLSGSPRHEVLTVLYVPVCPYCNRQYITKYGKIGEEETTADLDHFFHKSLYPFLALSVYNFVPSCSICNRTFKGTVDFYATPHLYPYAQQSNGEMKFKLNDIKLLWEIERWKDDGIEGQLAVKIEPGKKVNGNRKKAVDNNKQTFHLDDIYQSHTDQVYEIMCKALAYNDRRIKDLYEAFEIVNQKGKSKLFSSEEEVREMIFGQYLNEGELHKRPLAKMTHDLLEDLLPEIEDIKRKRGWQA